MIAVAVPRELRQALAAPLAERGLVVAGADPASVVLADTAPGHAAAWIALAPDAETAAALLDRGAADVVLPGDPPALIAARIARLVRPAPIRVGALAIDPVARRASREGRVLDLLPREYAVLLHLARHADALVTRPQLRAAVWGRDFDPGTNVIEVHVSRLRAALDRGAPPMLRTERGRGYRLVSQPVIAAAARAS